MIYTIKVVLQCFFFKYVSFIFEIQKINIIKMTKQTKLNE